jgi:hypothetical protein
MRISAHQMAVLDACGREKFPAQVASYIRAQHSQCAVQSPRGVYAVKDLPDAVLLRLIATALQRGQSHGLTWQSTLNAFTTLMFKVAPNFDQHPKIAAALAPDMRPPDFRMLELPGIVTPVEWQQAADVYDPGAWTSSAPQR